MEANGTRYHLVQGWPDWRRFTVNASGGAVAQLCGSTEQPSDVVWDCASSSVMLRPEVFRFPTAPADRPPTLDDRRGAGCDGYGNWYWIAPSGREILVQSSGSGAASHFWSAEDEKERQHEARYGDFGPLEEPAAVVPLALSGLAVTQDAYLVAGVLAGKGTSGAGALDAGTPNAGGSAGLLVFDLLAGGPPGGRSLPPNGDALRDARLNGGLDSRSRRSSSSGRLTWGRGRTAGCRPGPGHRACGGRPEITLTGDRCAGSNAAKFQHRGRRSAAGNVLGLRDPIPDCDGT